MRIMFLLFVVLAVVSISVVVWRYRKRVLTQKAQSTTNNQIWKNHGTLGPVGDAIGKGGNVEPCKIVTPPEIASYLPCFPGIEERKIGLAPVFYLWKIKYHGTITYAFTTEKDKPVVEGARFVKPVGTLINACSRDFAKFFTEKLSADCTGMGLVAGEGGSHESKN